MRSEKESERENEKESEKGKGNEKRKGNENRNKNTASGFQGVITVEASYLMPLLVLLIWNLLFLSFFVYDQTVMTQGSYCSALRTQRLIGEDAKRKREGEKKLEEAVAQRVVCGNLERQISVEEDGVRVRTALRMNAPAGAFFQSLWQSEEEQYAEKWEPVGWIRACRKADDLWKLISTGSERTP